MPHLSERSIIKLRALYSTKAHPMLQLLRKTVPYEVISAIAQGKPELICGEQQSGTVTETRKQQERPGFLEHSAA